VPAFARGGLGQCLVGRARSDSPGASVGAPPASRPCHVPLGRSSCSLADPRRPQQWSHPVQAGGQTDGGLAGRCVVCPQWRSLCRAPSGGLCFVPPVEVFVSCPQWRSLFRAPQWRSLFRASRRGLCSPPKRSLSAPPKRTFPCLRGGLCFRPAGGEGLVCPCLVRGLCNALSGRAERWVPPGASPFLPRPKDPEAGAPRRYPHHLRLFFVRGVSHTKTDRDTARPAPLELGRS
jgi:hypothetical protein